MLNETDDCEPMLFAVHHRM